MPPDMAEWLPSGHLAWFVLDVVAELDTSAFHARRVQAGPGRAAYDPDVLLALLVYGYAVGQRSSRRLEALCVTDVAFRVLCAQDAPDHTTIARFRAAHQDDFAELFAQVLMLCARAGMGRVGTVAIDGTKIAANASRAANRSEDYLRAQARHIVSEAAAVDAQEDDEFGDQRGDELPGDFSDRHGRRARIRRALEEVDRHKAHAEEITAIEQARAEAYVRAIEAGDAPRGRTPKGVDPTRVARARLRRAQTRFEEATDSQHRGDAAKDVRRAQASLTSAESDPARQGGALTRHTERVLDRPVQANTTDPESRLMTSSNGGSIQGYNAQIAVSDDHLILAAQLTQDANDVAAFEPMMHAALDAAAKITAARSQSGRPTELEHGGVEQLLADAGYLSDHNLTVPGPDRLIALGKARQLHRDAREHPAAGSPPVDATPIEQMRHRLHTPEGVTAYKRRGATVEPINAHLKDQIGLRRFSRRGLKAAASELQLAAAVVNLLKLHNRAREVTA